MIAQKKEFQGNIHVNYFLKFVPLIIIIIGIISGYVTLNNKVLSMENLPQRLEINEKQTVCNTIELKNIKETLIRIENQNQKMDEKIDKVLEIVIRKK